VANLTDDSKRLFDALETERIQMMIHRDIEGLSNLLSDSLIYGHSSGLLDDKASLLDTIRSNVVRYVRVDSQLDCITYVTPETAVIGGWLRTEVIIKQEPKSVYGRYMAVWTHGLKRWQLQALQGSNVPT
jgi:hypothetical protein